VITSISLLNSLRILPNAFGMQVEMGYARTLNTIAEEIKVQSDSCVPMSKRIIQIWEDSKFDGILKLADDLNPF